MDGRQHCSYKQVCKKYSNNKVQKYSIFGKIDQNNQSNYNEMKVQSIFGAKKQKLTDSLRDYSKQQNDSNLPSFNNLNKTSIFGCSLQKTSYDKQPEQNKLIIQLQRQLQITKNKLINREQKNWKLQEEFQLKQKEMLQLLNKANKITEILSQQNKKHLQTISSLKNELSSISRKQTSIIKNNIQLLKQNQMYKQSINGLNQKIQQLQSHNKVMQTKLWKQNIQLEEKIAQQQSCHNNKSTQIKEYGEQVCTSVQIVKSKYNTQIQIVQYNEYPQQQKICGNTFRNQDMSEQQQQVYEQQQLHEKIEIQMGSAPKMLIQPNPQIHNNFWNRINSKVNAAQQERKQTQIKQDYQVQQQQPMQQNDQSIPQNNGNYDYQNNKNSITNSLQQKQQQVQPSYREKHKQTKNKRKFYDVYYSDSQSGQQPTQSYYADEGQPPPWFYQQKQQ